MDTKPATFIFRLEQDLLDKVLAIERRLHRSRGQLGREALRLLIAKYQSADAEEAEVKAVRETLAKKELNILHRLQAGD